MKFIEAAGSDAAIEYAYPDLINQYIDAPRAIAMYRRFVAEARTVFNNYPSLKTVVQ